MSQQVGTGLEPRARPPEAEPAPRTTGRDGIRPRRSPATRFTLSCLAGAVPALGVFVWFVNLGTANFFRSTVFGNFFDLQARGLFHGRWDVPAGSLLYEGIVVHHRTYMYFGPFPALIRMPILLLTNRFDGRLTQLSMTLAFCVALVGVCRLVWTTRRLVRGDAAAFGTAEAVGTALLVLTIGVGTPLLFQASYPYVYQEAELWGAALALVGLDAVMVVSSSPRRRNIVVACALATAALLARPSVGLAPAAALGCLAVVTGLRTVRARRAREVRGRRGARGARRTRARPDPATVATPVLVLGLAAATLVPLATYGAVNQAKFGSPFDARLGNQLVSSVDVSRRDVLHANGGTLFNPKYAVSTVRAYFRPDAVRAWRLFPFVDFPLWRPHVGFGEQLDRSERTTSLPVTVPALGLLAALGFVGVLRRRHDRRFVRVVGPSIAGGAIAVLPTLALGAVFNRYLVDFVPLLVVLAAVGFHLLVARGRAARRPRWLAPVALGVVALALVELWVNPALTLVYQRLQSPAWVTSERGFVEFQQRVADTLGTSGYRVQRVARLPQSFRTDTLMVVGNCDGVYAPVVGETVLARWRLLELGPGGTHVRARLVLAGGAPARPVPLLVVGTGRRAIRVTLRGAGPGRLAIGVIDADGSVIDGSVFRIPKRPVVLDASLDRGLGVIAVRVGDLGSVSAAREVIPRGGGALATAPDAGGPVARARLEPVPTPLCRRLVGSKG